MLSNYLTDNVRLVSEFPQHTALLYQRPGLLDISSFKIFIQASFIVYNKTSKSNTEKRKRPPGKSPENVFFQLIFLISSIYGLQRYYRSPPIERNSGANTSDTTVISLIRMLMDGPDVSLNGSPTVSPTTAAL